MDYRVLEEELAYYFAALEALSQLKEMDRNIAACLDSAASYIESALEIAREKNPPRLGMPYRWLFASTEPEEALDLILALEDSSTPIKGE